MSSHFLWSSKILFHARFSIKSQFEKLRWTEHCTPKYERKNYYNRLLVYISPTCARHTEENAIDRLKNDKPRENSIFRGIKSVTALNLLSTRRGEGRKNLGRKTLLTRARTIACRLSAKKQSRGNENYGDWAGRKSQYSISLNQRDKSPNWTSNDRKAFGRCNGLRMRDIATFKKEEERKPRRSTLCSPASYALGFFNIGWNNWSGMEPGLWSKRGGGGRAEEEMV